MFHINCGILPVVDNTDKVIGMVSDRDICLSLGTRDERASDVRVEEVYTKKLYSCGPEDDLETALDIMGTNHVRRLPVVDERGKLVGIVSIDDIAEVCQSFGAVHGSVPTPARVVETLRKVHPMRAAPLEGAV
jgi:CBS domain-containing protein